MSAEYGSASYVSRANFFELFKMRRKAIEVIKVAVKQNFSGLELASGSMYLGLMYKKLGGFSTETKYFDLALKISGNEDNPYSSHFKIIVECFLENKEEDKVNKWRNHLIIRAR
ncbi:MAG: hypothetical protein KBT36_11135 [Kurthia sp.]|nr:hypothetical protein [Candidatus Kurthia equi]